MVGIYIVFQFSIFRVLVLVDGLAISELNRLHILPSLFCGSIFEILRFAVSFALNGPNLI